MPSSLYINIGFTGRTGCAEYVYPKQGALHSKLWTRGDSNHWHCAAHAMGVTCFVLFLIGIVCAMCHYVSVNGAHFQ